MKSFHEQAFVTMPQVLHSTVLWNYQMEYWYTIGKRYLLLRPIDRE